MTWAIAPITAHTNGDWPWRRVHGWKWSETVTNAKPACPASRRDEHIGWMLLSRQM